jgi:hypothetical protein
MRICAVNELDAAKVAITKSANAQKVFEITFNVFISKKINAILMPTLFALFGCRALTLLRIFGLLLDCSLVF